MFNLHISRNHHLDHDECHSLAEDLLAQLVEKYGGKFRAEGENLKYRHPVTGMSAIVQPSQETLDITVKLNMMTRSFGPQIEKEINRVLDKKIV